MTINGEDYNYKNLQDLTVKLIGIKGQDIVLTGAQEELDPVWNDVHNQEYVEYYDGPDANCLISPGNKKLYLVCQ